jgi:hypothetical protein
LAIADWGFEEAEGKPARERVAPNEANFTLGDIAMNTGAEVGNLNWLGTIR